MKIIHLKYSSALAFIRIACISLDQKICVTLATIQDILSIEVLTEVSLNNISQRTMTRAKTSFLGYLI